ncbi:MAG: DUF5076 domain-containing protein [Candidatus Sulfotelmatobacter sp.]
MPAELRVPPGALSDKQSCELVRAWAAHGGLQCALNVNAWTDDMLAIGWGILLSDIARHVADAVQQTKNLDRERTLSKIRDVFNSELDKPTGETAGKFV